MSYKSSYCPSCSWCGRTSTTPIEKNAEKLEKIENNQIRVISTVGMLEDELQRLEVEHEKASSERARVHHTSSKSCLECKVQGMEHYPAQLKTKNSFAK